MIWRLVFVFAVIVFCACQKELERPGTDPAIVGPPPAVIPGDSCRIATGYYYGGSGGINDTANFNYVSGKLVSVIGQNADVLYAYDGDRLLSMAYYEKPGNLLYRIDSFAFANDSLLSTMRSHDYDMYNHMDTSHAVLSFIYDGALLREVRTFTGYEGIPDQDTTVSEFRWENDNVKSILTRDTYWADDSIYYDYDNVPNYFRASSRYFFMADPFFQIHVGFDPHLPYFISKNNVTNFRYYSTIDYPVTYQVDSLNHPLLVSQGGFEYMGYRWECP